MRRGFRRRGVRGGRHRGGGRQDGGHAGEDGHLRRQHEHRRGTLNAPDPERQQPLGIEDSPDLFYQQTFEGGDELGDPALVRILADNALDAVHWMEDHGLVYEKEPFTAIGGLWQRGHAVEVEKKGEQGGSYYVSCLKDSADKTGKVTLYTDAKVEQLVEEDGKVTGVA